MSVEEVDDDASLKELVTNTLSSCGVLGKIQAQLRAAVFLALEDNLHENNIPLISKDAKEILNSPAGLISSAFVLDYLSKCGLNFTQSIFESELSNEYMSKLCINEKMQKEFSLDSVSNEPLLVQLINKVMQRSELFNCNSLNEKFGENLNAENSLHNSSSSGEDNISSTFSSTKDANGVNIINMVIEDQNIDASGEKIEEDDCINTFESSNNSQDSLSMNSKNGESLGQEHYQVASKNEEKTHSESTLTEDKVVSHMKDSKTEDDLDNEEILEELLNTNSTASEVTKDVTELSSATIGDYQESL